MKESFVLNLYYRFQKIWIRFETTTIWVKCKFVCYNFKHCPIKAVAWSTIAEKDFVTLNKFDKSANVYLLLSSECSLSMCVCIFYSENQCTVSNTVFA